MIKNISIIGAGNLANSILAAIKRSDSAYSIHSSVVTMLDYTREEFEEKYPNA